MGCKHDINFLIGTADGVVCRQCGKLFKGGLAGLKAELDADRAAQNEPKPEAPAADRATASEPAEKPKRTRKKKES